MSGVRTALRSSAPFLLPAWRRLYWSCRRAGAAIGWRLDRLAPAALARPGRSLEREITIGITTYVERYERWFRPLLLRIRRLFPEVRTVVAVNGFPDALRQDAYLRRLRRELAGVAGTTFLLHRHPEGVARLWNEIVDAARTPKVLLLNDDLEIALPFRRWLEDAAGADFVFATIRTSWSHFLITDECRRAVGPFDEGFVGMGFEDFDYAGRLALAGAESRNLDCPWIRHGGETPHESSFDAVGPKVFGKYTDRNRERFDEKWREASAGDAVFFARTVGRHYAPRRVPVPFAYRRNPLPAFRGEGPFFVDVGRTVS